MDYITEYIKEITCVALVIAFIKKLIPNNKYTKYTDMIIGLIMLMIMIKPFLKLVNIDNIYEFNLHSIINNDNYIDDDFIGAYYDYENECINNYKMEYKEELDNIISKYDYYVRELEFEKDNKVYIKLSKYQNNYENLEKIKIKDISNLQSEEYDPYQVAVIEEIMTFTGAKSDDLIIEFR